MTPESHAAPIASTGNRTQTETNPTDAELVALRAEGVSRSQIGLRLGLTKPQVDYRLYLLRIAGVIEPLPTRVPAPVRPPLDVTGPPLTTVEIEAALASFETGPWSAEKLTILCREWRAGTPTSQIGNLVGATKNAVVGKAHRLIEYGILESRDPPIKPKDDRTPRRAIPRSRATLPPLASGSEIITVPASPPPPHAVRRVVVTLSAEDRGPTTQPATVWVTDAYDSGEAIVTPLAPPPPPRPIAAQPRAAAPLQPRYGRIVTCCWPIGEPGSREFHFCDSPSERGRPYCLDHCQRAFVKVARGHAEPQTGTNALLYERAGS